MKRELDAYADLHSPVHRWEPRMRFIGLVAMIIAFSLVRSLALLPGMLVITLALYAIAHLPLLFLWKRLRSPGVFLLMMVVLLPFLSGSTVILQVGPLALRQEGLLDTALIVGKFISIMTVGLVLLGVAPFLTTVEAMRALGLPPLLADMTLFSYRYIYEIGDDLTTMQTAMGLRGFRTRHLGSRSFGALASLVGSILVRSYGQSERVYQAMTLRGYGHSSRSPDGNERITRRDVLMLALTLLVSSSLIAAEILFRRMGGQMGSGG